MVLWTSQFLHTDRGACALPNYCTIALKWPRSYSLFLEHAVRLSIATVTLLNYQQTCPISTWKLVPLTTATFNNQPWLLRSKYLSMSSQVSISENIPTEPKNGKRIFCSYQLNNTSRCINLAQFLIIPSPSLAFMEMVFPRWFITHVRLPSRWTDPSAL